MAGDSPSLEQLLALGERVHADLNALADAAPPDARVRDAAAAVLFVWGEFEATAYRHLAGEKH